MPITNLFGVGMRPITTTRPLQLPTPKPVLGLPLLGRPVGTVQNMGQEYEFQAYNADGTLVTRKQSLATLLFAELRIKPPGGQTFSPQTFGNLSSLTQQNEARLIASLNLSQADTAQVFQDSIKIDYALCVKSQQSQPVELNMLQTPQLQARFSYNFYEPTETDLASQEDQAKDPLLTSDPVPRQVYLTWDVSNTRNRSDDFSSRTAAEQQMVNQYINTVRGQSTLSNQPTVRSFQSQLATVQPIFRAGQALKLVDTHDLERAFNSTSNSRLFKNTAITTINCNSIDLNTINFNELILEDL